MYVGWTVCAGVKVSSTIGETVVGVAEGVKTMLIAGESLSVRVVA